MEPSASRFESELVLHAGVQWEQDLARRLDLDGGHNGHRGSDFNIGVIRCERHLKVTLTELQHCRIIGRVILCHLTR